MRYETSVRTGIVALGLAALVPLPLAAAAGPAGAVHPQSATNSTTVPIHPNLSTRHTTLHDSSVPSRSTLYEH